MTEFRVEQSGWYRTRDGQEVECIAIWSRPCGNGFQATCLDKNEAYDVTAYGRYFTNPEYEHGLDLIEYLGKERPKQKKVVTYKAYLNLYSNGEMSLHYGEEYANNFGEGKDYARRVIEWEAPDNG